MEDGTTHTKLQLEGEEINIEVINCNIYIERIEAWSHIHYIHKLLVQCLLLGQMIGYTYMFVKNCGAMSCIFCT